MLTQFYTEETGQEQLSIPVNIKEAALPLFFMEPSVTLHKVLLICGVVMVLWFSKAC